MAAAVHEGMRGLQDRFDGRRVAEAIEGKRKHYEFRDDEKEMIRNSAFFFIATSCPGDDPHTPMVRADREPER